MFKTILFWIGYVPLLCLWSVIRGVYIGFFGSIIGLCQRYCDCVKVEHVGVKRYPIKTLKHYFSAHKRSVGNDNYRLKKIKSHFELGAYKQPNILFSASIYCLYFLLFSPFFIIYGVLFKGPLSTFHDGLVYWKCVVLKRSVYDIYA